MSEGYLKDVRESLDEVDGEMMRLFERRMRLSEQIADFKMRTGMPIVDMERERKKVNGIARNASPDLAGYERTLYSLLSEMSKEHQRNMTDKGNGIREAYERAITETPRAFPENVPVSCYGNEGTFCQMACDRFFGMPEIMYFKTYESVLAAVSNGLCRYGVVPIETGARGVLDRIYDLLVERDLKIVRSVEVPLDYNLVANREMSRHEVTEIYLTEEAAANLGHYLSAMENVKYVICENEAVAAKEVYGTDKRGAAAITTYRCAALNGLKLIEPSIQGDHLRHARFICVGAKAEIYPGSDKTGIAVTITNSPGEIFKLISKFYVLGINISKIESRRILGRDFERKLYIDFEASIYSDEFMQLMSALDEVGAEIDYLGTYMEK